MLISLEVLNIYSDMSDKLNYVCQIVLFAESIIKKNSKILM